MWVTELSMGSTRWSKMKILAWKKHELKTRMKSLRLIYGTVLTRKTPPLRRQHCRIRFRILGRLTEKRAVTARKRRFTLLNTQTVNSIQLMDLSIDWLIDWLAYWTIDHLIVRMIVWLTGTLIHWLIDWLVWLMKFELKSLTRISSPAAAACVQRVDAGARSQWQEIPFPHSRWLMCPCWVCRRKQSLKCSPRNPWTNELVRLWISRLDMIIPQLFSPFLISRIPLLSFSCKLTQKLK